MWIVRLAFRRPHMPADLLEMLLGAWLQFEIKQPQQVARFRACSGTEQRRGHTSFLTRASIESFHHEPCKARMQRIASHAARFFAGCSQPFQQVLRVRDGSIRRLIEPVDFPRISHAHRAKVQAHPRQFAPHDFRRSMLRPAMKVFESVKPQDPSGCSACGAAGPLRRRCLADPLYFESRQARPRRVACSARQPAIDDGGDPFDGDGTLSDISRQNHLVLRGRGDGAVLLFGRKIAMQRKHQKLMLASKLLAFAGRAPYLGCPRQKHKHVASVLFG